MSDQLQRLAVRFMPSHEMLIKTEEPGEENFKPRRDGRVLGNIGSFEWTR